MPTASPTASSMTTAALRPRSILTTPLTAVLVTTTTSPVSIPAIGPNRIAAEMVALVAHSVVGQDWLFSIHCPEAMSLVESINATTTAISASTQAGRRPKPCKYATAHATLHAISTANSSQPIIGRSSSSLMVTLKPSA
jgi:hypothetical protein